ncbi:hypothetical protein HNQ09_002147 [Deinococcus budaensis]|uniref:Uncharacterized protein n=1 Tax=Deinococcus budaensis TaxID=1665626 RepID=A0A7W8GG40_9DEIO|nr:hypothetical protein [Deinococcus budaensis]MBB5234704.1 hypothetical protein [Deinococcus budaensis]
MTRTVDPPSSLPGTVRQKGTRRVRMMSVTTSSVSSDSANPRSAELGRFGSQQGEPHPDSQEVEG